MAFNLRKGPASVGAAVMMAHSGLVSTELSLTQAPSRAALADEIPEPQWLPDAGDDRDFTRACTAKGYVRACTFLASWPPAWHGRKFCCQGPLASGPLHYEVPRQWPPTWASASTVCGLQGLTMCTSDVLCQGQARILDGEDGTLQQGWLPAANVQDMWVMPPARGTAETCRTRFAQAPELHNVLCCPIDSEWKLNSDLGSWQAGRTPTPHDCNGTLADGHCPGVLHHGDTCSPPCNSSYQIVGQYTCVDGDLDGQPQCVQDGAVAADEQAVSSRDVVWGWASVFVSVDVRDAGGLVKDVLAYALEVNADSLAVSAREESDSDFWEQAFGRGMVQARHFWAAAASHLDVRFLVRVGSPEEGVRVLTAAQDLGSPGAYSEERCRTFLETDAALSHLPELASGRASVDTWWTWVQMVDPMHYSEQVLAPAAGEPDQGPAPVGSTEPGDRMAPFVALLCAGGAIMALVLLYKLRVHDATRSVYMVVGDTGFAGSCEAYNHILNNVGDYRRFPACDIWTAVAFVLIKDASACGTRKGGAARFGFVLISGALSFTVQALFTWWTLFHIVLPSMRKTQDVYRDVRAEAYDDHGEFSQQGFDELGAERSRACGAPLSGFFILSCMLFTWAMQCLNALQAIYELDGSIRALPPLPAGLPRSDEIMDCNEADRQTSQIVVCLSQSTRTRVLYLAIAPKLVLVCSRFCAGCLWLISAKGFLYLFMSYLSLGLLVDVDALVFASFLPSKLIGTLEKVRLAMPKKAHVHEATPGLSSRKSFTDLRWVYISKPLCQLACCGVLVALALKLQPVLPNYMWDLAELCEGYLQDAREP